MRKRFPGSANGLPKSFKTLGNDAKSAFRGAPTVTVPWPWVGDAPRKGVSSNAKSLETLVKRRVRRLRWRHFHCDHRPPQTVPLPANGFPKILRKALENKVNSAFQRSRGSYNLFWDMLMSCGPASKFDVVRQSLTAEKLPNLP